MNVCAGAGGVAAMAQGETETCQVIYMYGVWNEPSKKCYSKIFLTSQFVILFIGMC